MGKCSCCSYEQNTHKDFIRGGVEDSDFDDDLRYRHPKRRAKKTRIQRRPGCPAFDYSEPHLYIWTEEFQDPKMMFYRFFDFNENESKVCVGCYSIRSRRKSKLYEKRKENAWRKLQDGLPNPRRFGGTRRYSYKYFSWTNLNEDYVAFRKQYLVQNGYDSYYYGW